MEYKQILARSENYEISHEFEAVFLCFSTTRPKVLIGDFYGEPAAAVIDEKERFVIMAGDGLIIYN